MSPFMDPDNDDGEEENMRKGKYIPPWARQILLAYEIMVLVGIVFSFNITKSYSVPQYAVSALITFVSDEVLEGVNLTLLSRVMSSHLTRGTYNGGLLSTEAGTQSRVVADDAYNMHEELRAKKKLVDMDENVSDPFKVVKVTWMSDGSHWPGTWFSADDDHSSGDHAGIIQGQQAITDMVLSLDYYKDCHIKIATVESQLSFNVAMTILVAGSLTGPENFQSNFCRTFFLTYKGEGVYIVLNDMFRFIGETQPKEANQTALNDSTNDVSKSATRT